MIIRATIIFRMRLRSIGNKIRSLYPGASAGLTGLRNTTAVRCDEIFLYNANNSFVSPCSLRYSSLSSNANTAVCFSNANRIFFVSTSVGCCSELFFPPLVVVLEEEAVGKEADEEEAEEEEEEAAAAAAVAPIRLLGGYGNFIGSRNRPNRADTVKYRSGGANSVWSMASTDSR